MRYRAPGWLLLLIVLAIVVLSVFTVATQPLPFGLSSGLGTGARPQGPFIATGPARSGIGQPLSLGALTLTLQSITRTQDLSAGGHGPIGSFTVIHITVQNGGPEPIAPAKSDFRLVDDRGRAYAVDLEASRAASVLAKRRPPFEATVSPGGRQDLALAFEIPADATGLILRVLAGYGELEVPR